MQNKTMQWIFSVLRAGALGAMVLSVATVQAGAETITVFAASSLQKPLSLVANEYGKATGNTVVISYGASGPMALMIAQGAPADVIISADPVWVDMLEGKSLLADGSRRPLFGNTLVLIAPAASKTTLTIGAGFNLKAALGTGKLALCSVKICPAGTYGKEALVKLGVWEAVAGQVIEAESARSALNFVVQGEAPFGIVYGSDAKTEPGAKIIGTFPAASHRPVVYQGAVIATSKATATPDFLSFLQSPAEWKHFEAAGFTALPSSTAP